MWRWRSPDGTWPSGGWAIEADAKADAIHQATGKVPADDQVDLLFKSAARAGWAVVWRG